MHLHLWIFCSGKSCSGLQVISSSVESSSYKPGFLSAPAAANSPLWRNNNRLSCGEATIIVTLFHCITLCYTVLHWISLYYTAFHCLTPCYNRIHCVTFWRDIIGQRSVTQWHLAIVWWPGNLMYYFKHHNLMVAYTFLTKKIQFLVED